MQPRRFASTVAARVKASSSGSGGAARVGHVLRAAAERFDYNDAVVSTPQNIKFSYTQTLVRPATRKTFFSTSSLFFFGFSCFSLRCADE